MIGALKGVIFAKNEKSVTVMVNDVGYRVQVSPALLSRLSKNDEVVLYIHSYVREDALELYGFSSQADLELFELMIDVSGIGPRTAIGILDRGPDGIRKAVAEADVAFFTTVSGVGKKTAQRLIIELKPKIGDMVDLDLSGEISGDTQEVVNALQAVGYSQKEAVEAVRRLPDGLESVEEKVKEALKRAGGKA
jgi:Holliday junction DNA helicase RuvA